MPHLIARLPIFTPQEKVFAHELSFDFNPVELLADPAAMDNLPGDIAVSLFAGVDQPGRRKRRVLVEIAPSLLTDKAVGRLSKQTAILQLSEAFVPTAEQVKAIKKLKGDGFRIAIGAFALEGDLQEMGVLADIIVVDFTGLAESDMRLIPIWCGRQRIQTLAHSLMTREAFELAKALKYDYFHGPFFYEAKIVALDTVPGFKLNYLRLLQEINREDISFNKLDQIIKQDVSLTYKLIKYINSAAFGLREEVESIKHALSMLGTRQVAKWASMVSLTSMGEDLPEEALVTCVLRGRFLEQLGHRLGHIGRGDDLFFMGIFSMIDLFFGRPKEEVLKDIPIKEDVKSALLGGESPFKNLFKAVLAYEEGEWDPLHAHLATLGMPEEEVPDLYFEALDWTENIFLSEKPTA